MHRDFSIVAVMKTYTNISAAIEKEHRVVSPSGRILNIVENMILSDLLPGNSPQISQRCFKVAKFLLQRLNSINITEDFN